MVEITHCCANCGKPTTNPKYCSLRCNAICSNKNRVRSDESRRKTSVSVLKTINVKNIKNIPTKAVVCCTVCGTFVKKGRSTCSDECRHKRLSQKRSEWMRLNWKKTKVTGQSWLERSFEDWLRHNGCVKGLHGYLTEVKFVSRLTGRPGWVDFLFPTKKLVVELDGSQHEKRKTIDSVRDSYLLNKGYTVMRITHSEYRKKTKEVEIVKLLSGLLK